MTSERGFQASLACSLKELIGEGSGSCQGIRIVNQTPQGVTKGVVLGEVKGKPLEKRKGIFRFHRNFQERNKTVKGLDRIWTIVVVKVRREQVGYLTKEPWALDRSPANHNRLTRTSAWQLVVS